MSTLKYENIQPYWLTMEGFNSYNINLCCWLNWFNMLFNETTDIIRKMSYTQVKSKKNGILLCPGCLANSIR